MNHDDVQRFLASLEEEHRLYLAMIDVDRSQSELLANENFNAPDALLDLVHRKQDLMTQVGSIEQTLQPLREQWHQSRAEMPASLAAPVDSKLAALAETIRTLIELEDQAQDRLEALRGTALKDIETLRKKSQINKAYTAYGGQRQGPKFIDQRSEG